MRMDILGGLFILFVVCAATAAAGAEPAFVISFWCGPPQSEQADARYAEVAEANFNVVMPPCGPSTVKGNLELLDACAKHAMKAIIADNRILSKNSDDPEFEKNLDGVISDYAKHPALYGYYIVDEPNSAAFPKLAAINQYLLKKDPAHIPYINLFPTYASPEQLGNATYEEHVEQFLSVVQPKLLSYDHYCLFEGAEREGYFLNMEIIRAAAHRHGVPWVNIIQLVPHGPYRNPSEADLRWQVYTTLAYGSSGILYFTYWTPKDPSWDFRNAVIDNGERTEHYERVQRLNAEMKILSPILLKLRSTAVYHTGNIPAGARSLSTKSLVSCVEGAELVVGEFKGEGGSNWLMLVNRNLRKEQEAVVTFSQRRLIVQEVDRQTGRLGYLRVSTDSNQVALRLRFQPGEGRLFALTSDR